MNFWTTGRIDIKIAFEMFQPAMLEIENKIKAAIAGKDFGSSILSYDIVINIFEEQPEERFRYSAKSKETDIDVNIDHNEFLKGSFQERCILYVNAIIHSVEKIRNHKKIVDFDFEQFQQTLTSLREEFQKSAVVN
jgi:hypothetical protein